jgi:hypothetical protein
MRTHACTNSRSYMTSSQHKHAHLQARDPDLTFFHTLITHDSHDLPTQTRTHTDTHKHTHRHTNAVGGRYQKSQLAPCHRYQTRSMGLHTPPPGPASNGRFAIKLVLGAPVLLPWGVGWGGLCVPCRAFEPCAVVRALACSAVPCTAVHCRALPCHALLCLATPCRAVHCIAVPCQFLPYIRQAHPMRLSYFCSHFDHTVRAEVPVAHRRLHSRSRIGMQVWPCLCRAVMCHALPCQASPCTENSALAPRARTARAHVHCGHGDQH